jgi:hypothetical protein
MIFVAYLGYVFRQKATDRVTLLFVIIVSSLFLGRGWRREVSGGNSGVGMFHERQWSFGIQMKADAPLW